MDRPRIHVVGFDRIEEYGSISIGFEIRSRLKLPEFIEVTEDVRWKDYDEQVPERPNSLSRRFDVANWAIFLASLEEGLVGGCIVGWNSPDFDMLEGRTDLAVIVDLRVRPESRHSGVGRLLVESAIAWATERGCAEIRVESQDVNVAACRFYNAMGFHVISFEPLGYGQDIDEGKVIFAHHFKPDIANG